MNAIDMRQFIEPKSDQLNADDLIGGPRTITVTRVSGNDNAEQPVNIYYQNDGNKPFRPCKSMRRVMVQCWGPDASKYVGRSMTLYRDPKVQFGGMQVGGIRISHMSHIERDVTMALTATRAKRAPYTVKVLANAPAATEDAARKWADGYIAAVNAAPDSEALNTVANNRAKRLAELSDKRPELHTECIHALETRRAALSPDWQEGPADEDRGEAFTDSQADDWGADPIANIKAQIRKANGRESWEAAWAGYQALSGSMSDADADAIEALFSEKKAELIG